MVMSKAVAAESPAPLLLPSLGESKNVASAARTSALPAVSLLRKFDFRVFGAGERDGDEMPSLPANDFRPGLPGERFTLVFFILDSINQHSRGGSNVREQKKNLSKADNC